MRGSGKGGVMIEIDKSTLLFIFIITYLRCWSAIESSAVMEMECLARTSSMESRPGGPIANVICVVERCSYFSTAGLVNYIRDVLCCICM